MKMPITQQLRHNQEQDANSTCKKHILEVINTLEDI